MQDYSASITAQLNEIITTRNAAPSVVLGVVGEYLDGVEGGIVENNIFMYKLAERRATELISEAISREALDTLKLCGRHWSLGDIRENLLTAAAESNRAAK